jgi:hypothetical protein
MKETKAQKQARIKAAEFEAKLAYQEELIAAYPAAVVSILERACKVGFELTVSDGKFKVVDHSNRSEVVARLGVQYTEEDQNNLEDLTYEVQHKEAIQLESQRNFQLRQQALAKLTPEELKAFGIQ